MKFSAVILAFAAAAVAAPIETVAENEVDARQSGTTCGNNYYSASQINDALNQACSGQTVDGYPHQYNNYEGFSFPDPSPWYEYPIKESGPYTSGSPGADRVIFDQNCNYQGSITHTGSSSKNGFVGCSDTS